MPLAPHLLVDSHKRLEAATNGRVTVRTIEKVLRGESVRGDAGVRAREALDALGITYPKAEPTSA